MILTTGWWSSVPSLMLVPQAVLEELKRADTQTDRITLYGIDQGYSCNFNEGLVGQVQHFQRSSRIFDSQ